jgi:hypothetical protein
MARLSDHSIRDAEHALRAECALIVGLYVRRMIEIGKAYIQEAVEEASKEGRDVNGTAIGRAAAKRAAGDYFGGLAGETFTPVVEGEGDRALKA